jgi:hypothetical protein
MESLLHYFSNLTDPRTERMREHSLEGILFTDTVQQRFLRSGSGRTGEGICCLDTICGGVTERRNCSR